MNLAVIIVVPGMVVLIEIAGVEDKEGSSFSVIMPGLCDNGVVIEGIGILVDALLGFSVFDETMLGVEVVENCSALVVMYVFGTVS